MEYGLEGARRDTIRPGGLYSGMSRFRRATGATGALAALSALGAACASSSPAAPPPAPIPTVSSVPGAPPLLVGVGDLACPAGLPRTAATCRQADTAALAGRLRPAAVALLGDLQYDRGALAEFRASFARSWGRFGSRLHPAPGNHDYATPGAAGYYAYLGARAGPGRRGYYSFDLGDWHVVSLNSNCTVVSCAAGSAQERWLRADLATHPARCTLAFWHHPRFSSGFHGSSPLVAPFWSALHAAGADVILVGHDHDYERFGPQDATGRPDPRRGLRQFVVGTGGVNLRRWARGPLPNTQRRNDRTFGVLALSLQPGRYTWRFVPVSGGSFRDAGSAACR